MESLRNHPSHPRHVLEQKICMEPYTCDGCKEKGFGRRYRCEKCDFDLHEACTYNRIASVSHEYFPGSKFTFLRDPPKPCHPECRIRCDACRKDIRGFVFHCEKDDLDLHPCCRNLKKSYRIEDVEFNLHKKVKGKCVWCKSKSLKDGGNDNGWSYISACGEYHVHVACVIEMALEEWYKLKQNNTISSSSGSIRSSSSSTGSIRSSKSSTGSIRSSNSSTGSSIRSSNVSLAMRLNNLDRGKQVQVQTGSNNVSLAMRLDNLDRGKQVQVQTGSSNVSLAMRLENLDRGKQVQVQTGSSNVSLAMKLDNLDREKQVQVQSGSGDGRLAKDKFWRILKFIIKTIVSIVIGDPTMILASLFLNLLG